MDTIVAALVNAAPQLGVAGILLALLGLIWRAWTQDRSDYRVELAAASKRYNEELDELKADIRELRHQIDDLQAALDLEREARRKAEDMAAQARRRGRAS